MNYYNEIETSVHCELPNYKLVEIYPPVIVRQINLRTIPKLSIFLKRIGKSHE